MIAKKLRKPSSTLTRHVVAESGSFVSSQQRVDIVAPKRAIQTSLEQLPAVVYRATVRLSDPEMKPFMERMKAKVRDDPAFKQKLLQDAGVVDARGKLTKAFGG